MYQIIFKFQLDAYKGGSSSSPCEPHKVNWHRLGTKDSVQIARIIVYLIASTAQMQCYTASL